MNRVHLVPASFVWPFLEFLQDIGAPSGRFMACAGIPEHAFESQECLLPLHSLTRFAEFASRAEGFHLGLEVGRRTSLHRFGDYGLAILSSSTLKEALVTSERYCRLYNPGLRLMVLAEGNNVILRHRYPREFGEGYLQLEAYTLMIQINQAQQWFGSNWLPPEVHVDPKLAHEIRRFENLAGCQIVETNGATE